jgi:hypothetical protein
MSSSSVKRLPIVIWSEECIESGRISRILSAKSADFEGADSRLGSPDGTPKQHPTIDKKRSRRRGSQTKQGDGKSKGTSQNGQGKETVSSTRRGIGKATRSGTTRRGIETMPHGVNEQINDLIEKEQWDAARATIKSELAKFPDHHWLLDRLALTYYEERRYEEAFSIIERAFEKLPTCPLVLWDYAGTLDALGYSLKAKNIYNLIIGRTVESLATGECGEGLDWAKALYADAIFRTGVCYRNLGIDYLAIKYYREYLGWRSEGYGGIYDPRDVEQELAELEQSFVARDSATPVQTSKPMELSGVTLLRVEYPTVCGSVPVSSPFGITEGIKDPSGRVISLLSFLPPGFGSSHAKEFVS